VEDRARFGALVHRRLSAVLGGLLHYGYDLRVGRPLEVAGAAGVGVAILGSLLLAMVQVLPMVEARLSAYSEPRYTGEVRDILAPFFVANWLNLTGPLRCSISPGFIFIGAWQRRSRSAGPCGVADSVRTRSLSS
jgi:hypothetical protein